MHSDQFTTDILTIIFSKQGSIDHFVKYLHPLASTGNGSDQIFVEIFFYLIISKGSTAAEKLGSKPLILVELIYDEAEWKQYDVAARNLCNIWRKPKKQIS